MWTQSLLAPFSMDPSTLITYSRELVHCPLVGMTGMGLCKMAAITHCISAWEIVILGTYLDVSTFPCVEVRN